MKMNIYFYFGLVVLLALSALWSFRIVDVLVGETNTFYPGIMETARLGFLISIFLQLAFIFLLYRTVKREDEDGVGTEKRYCFVQFGRFGGGMYAV